MVQNHGFFLPYFLDLSKQVFTFVSKSFILFMVFMAFGHIFFMSKLCFLRVINLSLLLLLSAIFVFWNIQWWSDQFIVKFPFNNNFFFSLTWSHQRGILSFGLSIKAGVSSRPVDVVGWVAGWADRKAFLIMLRVLPVKRSVDCSRYILTTWSGNPASMTLCLPKNKTSFQSLPGQRL